MAIFNSYATNYQRVLWFFVYTIIPLYNTSALARQLSYHYERCRKAEAVPILRGVVLGVGILISAAAQMSADQTSAMWKTGAK